MLSKSLKIVFFSSLGLSFFLSNSAAFAQIDNSNDSVVVPTVPSGSSTPVNNPYPYPDNSSTPVNNPYPDSSTNIPPSSTADSGTRFFCQPINGQYTVVYQPQSQPGQYFPWAAPATLGGGWNAQSRCQAIATRLESYRPDGLQELQISVLNRENIICVTTEADRSCRIVLTVPRNKDPYTVRDSVFRNFTSADSGQQTIAVNTYGERNQGGANNLYNLGRTILGNGNNGVTTSSKRGINLKPYLDPRDGGTARGLRNGVAVNGRTPAKTRLNPGNFR